MNTHQFINESFSIGIELPLDNDWSSTGQIKRQQENRPFGVPDMKEHASRIKLADKLGYRAAWGRDVPFYDPNFGDAAQVFEPFSYQGYLAGITENILLGTAAIVLPLRQPWLVRKSAATLQTLSHERLLLGVASGDRPIEYPLFDVNYPDRGKLFRQHVDILTGKKDAQLPTGVQILPEHQPIPLFVAGLAQQSPEWIGQHMQGWLAYPGTPIDHTERVKLWRNVAGSKPYVSFIHLDFIDDINAPIQRHRFGVKTGRNGLIKELTAMKAAGVNHIGLQFRRNERPIEETLEDISLSVLPEFHQ